MSDSVSDRELAEALFARWQAGESKSQLEIEAWGDGTSHGRHFDRFIRTELGVATSRPSKQSGVIEGLQRQVRSLGGVPVGSVASPWLVQLLHARQACLEAIRVWNDPTSRFRAGTFSLLFVAAWNGLAISHLQRAGREWRQLDGSGQPVTRSDGGETSMDTIDLVSAAFPGGGVAARALRENVRYWVDLRNCVAHRFLPAVDAVSAPQAQAGLLNFEQVLRREFGDEYAMAESLFVPLQLSGFRDPGVLASRKAMQASLPVEVQAVLNRADRLEPEVAADPSFQMRVAFIPVVPSSGRGADAIAYFLKPGEVPEELEESLERMVVVPKIWKATHWFRPSEVADEVQRRTGFRFYVTPHHSEAAVRLGARPTKGEAPRTLDITLAEYVSSFKQYQYTQRWIDLLVDHCSTPEGFLLATGKPPISLPSDSPKRT